LVKVGWPWMESCWWINDVMSSYPYDCPNILVESFS
jgi:hypothetical protein